MATPADVAHILVIAGQSNAMTWGTYQVAPPEDFAQLTEVFIWDRNLSAFVPYHAGVNSNIGTMVAPATRSATWGTEAAFALLWRRDRPVKPLHIVKLAVGGTHLFDDEEVDWNINSTDEYTDMLMSDVHAAKIAITAQGKRPVVEAIAWNQGEADTKRQDRAAAYKENLTAVRDKLMSTIGNLRTVFVIERIRPTDPSNIYIEQVRDAQAAVAAEDGSGKTRMVDLDIDDFTLLHPPEPWIRHKGELVYEAVYGTT